MTRYSGHAGAANVAAADVTGIKSWSLDWTFETHETTGFDSSGHKAFIPGLDSWSGSFEGYKNGAPLTIGTEVALVLEETQTASQKFNGQAIITGLSVNAAVDGVVTYSYTFQGTGALTLATT